MQQMIPVSVCGDYWVNPQEVWQQLQEQHNNDTVTLDMGTEGASLESLEISRMLDQWLAQHNRKPDTIIVDKWPNTVENIPYQRAFRPRISHFFWMSDRYRPSTTIPTTHQYRFAYFLGRQTLPRRRIMWDMYRTKNVLLSVMLGSYGLSPSIDNADQWSQDLAQQQLDRWFENCPVPCLDGHLIQNQYKPDHNTNYDILEFYNQFDIEIVAETYTLGNVFFPTEKTIRPLCAGRPILLYGPTNFLSRLHELGFQTWNSIWDETYDQYQGWDRWQMMQTVIKDLSSRNQQQLWDQCQAVCQHNHALVGELSNQYGPNQ